MNAEALTRAARHVLADRLGRMRGSLEELGAWFREHFARLVARHVGEAVRDALAAALGRPARPGRYGDEDGDDGYGGRHPYSPPDGDDDEDDGFWGGWPREREAEPKGDRRRWDALLACVAQVGAWWLRQGLPRASVPR